MKRLIPVLLLIGFFTSSCHFFHDTIKGNGNVVKDDRNATGFNSIDVSGGINVVLTQDSSYDVQVEIDENLQEYIEVYVSDGDVLRIHQKNNTSLDATGSIKVYVNAPMYKDLSASGACTISSKGKMSLSNTLDVDLTGASSATLDVRAPNVKASISGAGVITMAGETKDFIADGSGSCHFNCFDLMSENADIELSGAGSAKVFASVKLDARCSGAASVRYKGNPAVNSDVSGAGSVKRAD